MSKRSKHTTKTFLGRLNYQQSIVNLNTEATVDEQPDFNSTTRVGPETSEPKSKKKRQIPIGIKIRDFLSSNWVGWVVLVVGGVLAFLLFDAKAELTIIHNSIEQQNKQIDRLYTEVDNINTKQDENANRLQDDIDNVDNMNDLQDILLTEIRSKLENLEKSLLNIQNAP